MKEKIDIEFRWHRIGAKPSLSTSVWGNYMRDRDEDVCDIASFDNMGRYAKLKEALQPFIDDGAPYDGKWITIGDDFFKAIMPVAKDVAIGWAEQKPNECPDFLTAQTRRDDHIVNFAAVLSRINDGAAFGWEMQIRISAF